MRRSSMFDRLESNERVREINERALKEALTNQMMQNTINENTDLRSEIVRLKGQLEGFSSTSAMQDLGVSKQEESAIPEAAMRGVSIRGLKSFAELVQTLCEDGVFSQDKIIDYQLYPGTTVYAELKTAQLVHTWVRDPSVSGESRLVDCPKWVDQEEVGKPDYFVSHAWKNSFADLLKMVFEFQEEKGLTDDTKFW